MQRSCKILARIVFFATKGVNGKAATLHYVPSSSLSQWNFMVCSAAKKMNHFYQIVEKIYQPGIERLTQLIVYNVFGNNNKQ